MLTTYCRRRSSLSKACQFGVVAGRTSVFQAGKKVKAGLFSKIHTRGEELQIFKFIVEEAWQWEKALINKSLRHLERRGLTFGQGLSQGPLFREQWALSKIHFCTVWEEKDKGRPANKVFVFVFIRGSKAPYSIEQNTLLQCLRRLRPHKFMASLFF